MLRIVSKAGSSIPTKFSLGLQMATPCSRFVTFMKIPGHKYNFMPTGTQPQGVVTAMCPVLPPATAIKVKSRDQAHRRATIKGSRWRSGRKYDQNQNKNARRYNIIVPCTHCFHCTLSRRTDIMVNY